METQEGNSKGSQIEMLDRTAVWVCRGRKAGERTQTHRVSSNTRGTDGAAARRGGRPANERLGQLWANAPGKALGGLNRTRSCDLKLLPATEPPFCQRPTVQLWTLLVSCTWLGVDPLDNAGCVGTGSHITTLFSCIPDITNPPESKHHRVACRRRYHTETLGALRFFAEPLLVSSDRYPATLNRRSYRHHG